MNIRDRIKAIDDEYSESEIYLEYGLPSLMLYEPTPYKNLIVDINIERDKYTATEDRMKFISLYKQVYLAQRKKLKAILAGIEARTIAIFPEPMKEEMIGFWVIPDDMMIRFRMSKTFTAMLRHVLEELLMIQMKKYIY